LFGSVSQGFWDSRLNRLEFMEWAADRLHVIQKEDWYHITLRKLEKLRGAGGLLFRYKGSLQRALFDLYPEYNWKPWLFVQVSSGFYENDTNSKNYIQWLAFQLNIKRMDDWYNVSRVQLVSLGCCQLLKLSGGIFSLLRRCYPDYEWIQEKFHFPMNMGKSQR